MTKAIARGVVALGLLFAPGSSAVGQALDPASAEALAATLRLLQDPALRAPALAAEPKAAASDRQLRALAGSEQLTQELYELAAEIFGELTRASGGDGRRMTEALEQATRDPAGFAAMLSPRTRERLRALSIRISDQPR